MENKEQGSRIHKDMTIDDIFAFFPEKSQMLALEMSNAGLSCVGCGAASFETLEAGVLGHGFSEEELYTLIDKLNLILDRPVELSTGISVTKRAAEKFMAIVEDENLGNVALRFGDKPGGCGGYEYIFDFSKAPSESDEVFTSNGIDIHVEKTSLSRLQGCEIDFAESLTQSGFKVSNPNVKGSCHCGSSQSY